MRGREGEEGGEASPPKGDDDPLVPPQDADRAKRKYIPPAQRRRTRAHQYRVSRDDMPPDPFGAKAARERNMIRPDTKK
jgi:hypothetical protein